MKYFKNILGVFVMVALLLPNTVFAAKIDEVKSSGKLTIKSIPPTNDEEAYMMDEVVYNLYDGYGIDVASCNDNYTECDMMNYGTGDSFKVSITYLYDSAVKTVVDNILKKIPAAGKIFYLNDIETIMYIRDYANYEPDPENPDDELSPLKYSSEYNEFIGYKNFVFEPRMGYDDMFSLYRGGTATFTYDDTIYGYVDGLGVRLNNILYVNDDEKDIENAIKTRLSKYFKVKSVTKDEITLDEIIEDELEYQGRNFDECVSLKEEIDAVPLDQRNTQEYSMKYSNYMSSCMMYQSYSSKADYLDSVLNDQMLNEKEAIGLYNFYDEVLQNVYVVEFEDGIMIPFFVSKNSKKVFNDDLEIITSDASLGVEISTNSLIPLDTLIQVAKITSGEEYDKIVKILKVTNNEIFDLKLFSKSASDYITKLDNGYFEVRIPISDKLKDKNLAVYYINDDDSVEKIDVVVEDGFAVFKTNHFSIYTLAEVEKTEEVKTNNPQTGDKINTYIIIGIISIIGLGAIVAMYYINKKRKK